MAIADPLSCLFLQLIVHSNFFTKSQFRAVLWLFRVCAYHVPVPTLQSVVLAGGSYHQVRWFVGGVACMLVLILAIALNSSARLHT